MDGGMCVIVVLSTARGSEVTVLQTDSCRLVAGRCNEMEKVDIPTGETSPGRISGLFANEGHEIELRIVDIGFRARIREETLLV